MSQIYWIQGSAGLQKYRATSREQAMDMYNMDNGLPRMSTEANPIKVMTRDEYVKSVQEEEPKAYSPTTGERIAGLAFPVAYGLASRGESVPAVAAGAVADVGLNLASAFVPPLAAARFARAVPSVGQTAARLGAEAAIGGMTGAAGGALSGEGAGSGAAVGTLAPLAMAGLGKGVRGAGWLGRQALGQTTGVGEEALSAFGLLGSKSAKAISSEAKSADEIAQQLVNDLDNFEAFIPESNTVDAALNGKFVSISDVIGDMGKGLQARTPSEKAAIAKVSEWRDTINSYVKDIAVDGMIPAQEARKIRQQLDATIDWEGQGIDKTAAKMINDQFLKARSGLKGRLVEAGGDKYADAMKSWATKLDAKEELQNLLGKTEWTQRTRAQSIVGNLYGANKAEQQRIMKKFDETFGKDYSQRIRNYAYAKQLGIGEQGAFPSIIPTQRTGFALPALAALGSAATGNFSFLPMMAVGSPLMASQAIGLGKTLGGAMFSPQAAPARGMLSNIVGRQGFSMNEE